MADAPRMLTPEEVDAMIRGPQPELFMRALHTLRAAWAERDQMRYERDLWIETNRAHHTVINGVLEILGKGLIDPEMAATDVVRERDAARAALRAILRWSVPPRSYAEESITEIARNALGEPAGQETP